MLKTAQEEFYVVTQKQPLFELECEICGSKVGKTGSNYIIHLKKLQKLENSHFYDIFNKGDLAIKQSNRLFLK
jgi:hypothetical protein